MIETYNAAIARIHAEPDQQDIEIALKALLWITFSREPLQTGTLLHALAIREDNQDINESDLEDIQKVVSLCVGLASIDQKGGEVRLVHETTKEYLQTVMSAGPLNWRPTGDRPAFFGSWIEWDCPLFHNVSRSQIESGFSSLIHQLTGFRSSNLYRLSQISNVW